MSLTHLEKCRQQGAATIVVAMDGRHGGRDNEEPARQDHAETVPNPPGSIRPSTAAARVNYQAAPGTIVYNTKLLPDGSSWAGRGSRNKGRVVVPALRNTERADADHGGASRDRAAVRQGAAQHRRGLRARRKPQAQPLTVYATATRGFQLLGRARRRSFSPRPRSRSRRANAGRADRRRHPRGRRVRDAERHRAGETGRTPSSRRNTSTRCWAADISTWSPASSMPTGEHDRQGAGHVQAPDNLFRPDWAYIATSRGVDRALGAGDFGVGGDRVARSRHTGGLQRAPTHRESPLPTLRASTSTGGAVRYKQGQRMTFAFSGDLKGYADKPPSPTGGNARVAVFVLNMRKARALRARRRRSQRGGSTTWSTR